VTGLTDASLPFCAKREKEVEGSFNILIAKSLSVRIGWRVQARFIIELHIKDLALLKSIKKFFNNAGTIIINNKKKYSLVFSSRF
jgi:hypothetical protein